MDGAGAGGRVLDGCRDAAAAVLAVELDALFGDGGEVAVGVGNAKGGEFACGQARACIAEAGPAAFAAAADVRPRHLNDLRAVQRDDPTQGTGVAFVASVPAHCPAPLHAIQQVLDKLREDGRGGFAFLPGHGVDIVVAHDEVCGRNALAAGEAGGCSCGQAVGIEGAVGGRAAAFDSFVVLTR